MNALPFRFGKADGIQVPGSCLLNGRSSGIFASFIMEPGVYPAIDAIWKWSFELKEQIK
jgi:hypothetical protein